MNSGQKWLQGSVKGRRTAFKLKTPYREGNGDIESVQRYIFIGQRDKSGDLSAQTGKQDNMIAETGTAW